LAITQLAKDQGMADSCLRRWIAQATQLGELDAHRAAHVGAAYRHDCVSAHRYFLRSN
jgi:transposase-like protein